MRLYRFGFCQDSTTIKLPDASMVGAKAANLYKLYEMGVRVPEGLVIPCWVSMESKHVQGEYLGRLIDQLVDPGSRGWLWSVRSGSPKSMPGMMDTILNVGITSQNFGDHVDRLGETAYKVLCRFLTFYARVVYGVELGGVIEALSTKSFEVILKNYESAVGKKYPDTLAEQVQQSVKAVWRSYQSPRARYYRKKHEYPEDMGTGVIVQRMVFGNRDNNSGTGVVFSRSPVSGDSSVYGEYLPAAQGEDIVSGTVTPQPIGNMARKWPNVYRELEEVLRRLERVFADMQDVEFTIESGVLYILQTRRGGRTNKAAVRIVTDLFVEGIVERGTTYERLLEVDYTSIAGLEVAHPEHAKVLTIATPGGGGVVKGVVVTSDSEARNSPGDCILCLAETDVNSVQGIANSVGVVTSIGGATSHAAVVARSLGKAAVVGAKDMVPQKGGGVCFGDAVLQAGDSVVLDGGNGVVYTGNTRVVGGEVGWFRDCLDTVLPPVQFLRVFSPWDVSSNARVVVISLLDFGFDYMRLVGVLLALSPEQMAVVVMNLDSTQGVVPPVMYGERDPNTYIRRKLMAVMDCPPNVIWIPWDNVLGIAVHQENWWLKNQQLLESVGINAGGVTPDSVDHFFDIFQRGIGC